jgi:hypothetical protein
MSPLGLIFSCLWTGSESANGFCFSKTFGGFGEASETKESTKYFSVEQAEEQACLAISLHPSQA